ncbi:site-2 protease family protein [Candidatus Parcubacteria bacterium]|nr:site-2 protease family protein [Candidatus Parcubacteria bacterium]
METFFQIILLVMSVVVHEVSHGYAAFLLGDPTAKNQGRLTLNPIRHLDFFGSILIPAFLVITNAGFLFGWAKPVPYNPYNLRNQKWGEAIVAVAGPASNIFIASVFGLLIRFGAEFLSPAFLKISAILVLINLMLAVFNLVPIPPLDGSKILFAFLPYHMQKFRMMLEQYGFFAVLIFIFFLSGFLAPIMSFLFSLITGYAL